MNDMVIFLRFLMRVINANRLPLFEIETHPILSGGSRQYVTLSVKDELGNAEHLPYFLDSVDSAKTRVNDLTALFNLNCPVIEVIDRANNVKVA